MAKGDQSMREREARRKIVAMGRAPCCDKANVKKGPWSPEEDAKLKSYMEKQGTGGNWIALPQKIGLKRCGKSCRLRWLNYLRPNIKHGGFSEEEDIIICNLYISIGSRWSIIASQLPGRTDNDIKNYWNTRLKKKLFGKQQQQQRKEQQHIRQRSCLKQDFKRPLLLQERNVQPTISNSVLFCANYYCPQPNSELIIHPAAATIHAHDIEEGSTTKLLLKLGGRLYDDSIISPSTAVRHHQPTLDDHSSPSLVPDPFDHDLLLANSSGHDGEDSQLLIDPYSFSSELDDIFNFNSVKLEELDWVYSMCGLVDEQNINGLGTTESTANWNEENPNSVHQNHAIVQDFREMQQCPF